MRELALFAGAGGGILGGHLLGWRTVCAVEIDQYCRGVLLARQGDGMLPVFPIWDDVRTFNGKQWAGRVDVISGGFPCQDISSAGKRAGIDGAKSGLWREFARIIGEVRPPWVFIENSPNLCTKGLVRILKDLADMGFDAEWGVLGADSVGAPHIRKRMWIVAHADVSGKRDVPQYAEMASSQKAPGPSEPTADSDGTDLRIQPGRSIRPQGEEATVPGNSGWWPVDLISGVDDGMANRVDRIKATGNGQVPGVAALAWRTLSGRF